MGNDPMSEDQPERRFRTLFISDVHLGARGSQADKLLDFLKRLDRKVTIQISQHKPGEPYQEGAFGV